MSGVGVSWVAWLVPDVGRRRAQAREVQKMELLAGLYMEVLRRGGASCVQFRDAVPRIVVLGRGRVELLDVRVDEGVSVFDFGAEHGRVGAEDFEGAVALLLEVAGRCSSAGRVELRDPGGRLRWGLES